MAATTQTTGCSATADLIAPAAPARGAASMPEELPCLIRNAIPLAYASKDISRDQPAQ
jgi:hypothetical protein